jgi:hypothetical protein
MSYYNKLGTVVLQLANSLSTIRSQFYDYCTVVVVFIPSACSRQSVL